MLQMTQEEWLDCRESYEGYCTACGDWTRDSTEPDAVGYDCPECDGNTVVGAEMAMICEHIIIVDD